MKKYFSYLLENANRHEMFLVGLFWSYFLLSVMGILLNYISGDTTDLLINLIFLILTGLLYGIYLKTSQYKSVRDGLVLLITVSTYVILVANDFQVSYFHIMVPLIFFLLYSLKTSLWIILVHTIVVIALYTLGYAYVPDTSVLPDMNRLFGAGLASLAFVLFGISFHLSIEASYKKLEKANEKNRILVREIHHRVKNNLGIISALLGMQQIKQKNNPEVKKILSTNRLRIDAIAMVHESLYKNKDIEQIDISYYLQELVKKIILLEGPKKIRLNIDGDKIILPFEQAMSIGIITNEFVLNTIKHAFVQHGEITIRVEMVDNDIIYHYGDNGTVEVNLFDVQNGNTLGMKLVQIMIEQIGGVMEARYDNGLKYTIRIPCNEQ